jgi:hypothetical protein
MGEEGEGEGGGGGGGEEEEGREVRWSGVKPRKAGRHSLRWLSWLGLWVEACRGRGRGTGTGQARGGAVFVFQPPLLLVLMG